MSTASGEDVDGGRRRQAMRVWVGRGNNTGGQEVSVLRVTPFLVIVSAGLHSITRNG